MTRQTLNKITHALKQLQAEGNFSARIVTDYADLGIKIKDFGTLALPIKPTHAKALIKQARLAKYGLKDQTILDPQVRNVWEIPKSRIKIDKRRWNKTLNPSLLELSQKLGLQEGQQLKAQLHSFLIYEKGQFFQPHQDTEKTQNMVATLIVLLPSAYRGGTLVVKNQGDSQRYPSTSTPENKLTFIAFYADCQHEVKPVTDGYRMALSYNLILESTVQREISIAEHSQQALNTAIEQYFKQPIETKRTHTPGCRKLVYLLDHEYTANGLKWHNLKANDQIRAQALLNSATDNQLEVFLTLADMHESWYCSSSYVDDYYSDWVDEDSLELEELLEDDTEIRHWLDSKGKKLKYPVLSVEKDFICWTKSNNEYQPFEKEYEGFMGNWGNTMNYWYHRAAIILWQEVDHYNVLLEFNPARVIKELLSKAEVLKKTSLKQLIQNLLKDWSGLSTDDKVTDYTRVLKLAIKINDADLAYALLEKLNTKALTVSSIKQWLELEKIYGATWCITILKHWHTNHSYQKQAIAITGLDKIIRQLCLSQGNTRSELQDWMLEHQWQVFQAEDKYSAEHFQTAELLTHAEEHIQDAKIFLDALLNSHNKTIHKNFIRHLLTYSSLYPPVELVKLLLSLRHDYQAQPHVKDAYIKALQTLFNNLTKQMQKGPRQTDDWSIMDKNRCSCNDCQDLKVFLQARNLQQKTWPLNKQRRMHIHQTIEAMHLPVTHETQRTGSPYKLILKKTRQLFIEDKKRYKAISKAIRQLSDSGLLTKEPSVF